MKTSAWLILSLSLHLAVAVVLWWGPLATSSAVHDDYVDLTFAPTLGGGKASQKRAKVNPAKANAVPAEKAVGSDGKSTESAAPTTEASAGAANAEAGLPGLGAGDEAVGWSQVTRLPKVSKEVKATYPEEAKQARIDGPVNLEILIDRTGKVKEIKMLSGPGYGLDESAIAAVKQFEFLPAQKGSEAVAVKIRYTYRFKLGVN